MSISTGRRKYQWRLLAVAALVLFGLGLAGFTRYAAWHNLPNSFWDNLYLTLQLIPLNSGAVEPPVPFELELARFFIPILTGAATATVVLDLFREQIRMLRLRGLRGQIIIFGLSRKGLLLANEFRRQGNEVVVIEQDEGNDWLESCRVQGMFVLLGDAADPVLLRQAGVQRARGVFAVCDEDGINVEIAIQMQALTEGREGEALPCLVHVSDPQLCALLREQESGLEHMPFRIELFNVFERGARRLLQAHPAWSEERAGSGNAPHLLLVGLGRMGENLLLHAIRDWRTQTPDATQRLKITIVDRRADQKIESLYVRYQQLAAACELIPLQMDVHSPEFERARFLFNEQGSPCIGSVYICVDDDSLGLHAGLTLLRQLPDHSLPVVIRMAEESGLARLLEDRKNHPGAYRNLFAFGYLDRTCTPDLLNNTPRDILARARHEEYVQQQHKVASFFVESPTLRPWEQLDERYREANYQWVDHLRLLLKESGYGIVPLTGWDIPLLEFSVDEMERMACLGVIEQEPLSDSARKKERLPVNEIPAFLGRAGFQVSREM
jgi:hypothetical protein